jgi:hypothetical protein
VADSTTRTQSPISRRSSTSDRDTVHFQLSPLLMIGVVAAVISTVAVVVSAIVANQPPPGPFNPQGPPGPPPQSTALLISLGCFVVSWVTVAVAVARDQLAQRIARATEARTAYLTDLHAWMESVRVEEANERAALMAQLTTQLDTLSREYGEQRETEGYLSAMRAAAGPPTKTDIRPLRRIPPQDHEGSPR